MLLPKLKLVRNLLADPARWTRDAFARDEAGAMCMPTDPQAVCWCITGAFIKVVGHTDFDVSELDTGRLSLTVFNDSATHSEVIRLLDSTIERLAYDYSKRRFGKSS